jgi:hypothetical protein
MDLRNWFFSMIKVRHDAKRWIYVPYALALATVLFFGVVSEEERGSLLPYLVLLPLIIIQLFWPTVAGWAAIVVTWFVLIFLNMLYARLFIGITEFNIWVLVLIGLLPIVPLYIFRPHSQEGRTPAGPRETGDAKPGTDRTLGR